jgi:hypothetical protein
MKRQALKHEQLMFRLVQWSLSRRLDAAFIAAFDHDNFPLYQRLAILPSGL